MNFGILLSQNQTPIFKYIVWVLGKIMEGIFWVLDKIGIPNIGLAIIVFTIVVNLILIPLTYKQQKFSKLSQKINPEIKAIQKKYEGKKDQDSQMAMNNEVQAVYGKYGISPTGSCLFLVIQMPILFALYRVIYQMPGYVAKIKDAFYPLVSSIASNESAVELVKGFKNSAMFAKQFTKIDGVKFTLENFMRAQLFTALGALRTGMDILFDSEHVKKDAQIPLQNEEGQRFWGRVTEITDTQVTVDLNHPLAGKNLFDRARIRIRAGRLGCTSVSLTGGRLVS